MPNLYDGDSPRQDATAKLFPVKLTGAAWDSVNSRWLYDWTEQSFDPATGLYLDMDSPRAGDTTNGPFLVELNREYVPTPIQAWILLRGIVDGDLFYEFEKPDLSEIVEVTSLSPEVVELDGTAKGGTAVVYPAAVSYLGPIGWAQGEPCWWMGVNDEIPTLFDRYSTQLVAVDVNGVKIYGNEICCSLVGPSSASSTSTSGSAGPAPSQSASSSAAPASGGSTPGSAGSASAAGNSVVVVENVTCYPNEGLQVDLAMLTGTVTIGGVQYPVTFTLTPTG